MMMLWCFLALATPQDNFDAGVVELRTEDALAAEGSFASAIEAGGVNANVYHGLGNALFRQDRIGEAIAAWQRGLMLEPQHEDLAYNIHQFRKVSVEGYSPYPNPILSNLQKYIIFLILLSISFGLGIVLPQRKLGWGTSSLLTAIFTAWFGFGQTLHSHAILILPSVLATSMPEGAGVELFTLNEGVDVQILEQASGSYRIALHGGQRGWIPKQSLILTDPDSPFVIQ